MIIIFKIKNYIFLRKISHLKRDIMILLNLTGILKSLSVPIILKIHQLFHYHQNFHHLGQRHHLNQDKYI
jgi:hypothetical protein